MFRFNKMVVLVISIFFSFHSIHSSSNYEKPTAYKKPIIFFIGHVTFDEDKIDEYDAKSFVILDDYFAYDKNIGFFRGEGIEGSDGMSFHILEDGYAADKNTVYFGLSGIGSGSYYSSFVYYKLLILEGLNPKEFVMLDGGYVRDDLLVFKDGEVLQDCDAFSFHRLGDTEYSVDKNHVYWRSKKIQKADRDSFYNAAGTSYAGDKNNIYRRGKIISPDDEDYGAILESLG